MRIARREFLRRAAAAVAAPALPSMAWAQTYPTRPVRMIVGFAAGGAADILARLMGQWLSERLGQPFVIENRPGAGTNIATEAVVSAPPDGYTLLLVSASNAINATLYDKLNFNFIRDIAPVAGIIRAAQCHGGESIGSGQDGSRVHRLCQGQSGQDQHGVGRHREPAPCVRRAVQDDDRRQHGARALSRRGARAHRSARRAGASHVRPMPAAIEYIRAGKLRALAVTTATRSEALPDIPTVGDFVPGYEASAWYGVGAPRNTPAEIVDKLNKEINAALADPKMKARLADLGGTVLAGSPADFGKLIADETEKWGKVGASSPGLRPED